MPLLTVQCNTIVIFSLCHSLLSLVVHSVAVLADIDGLTKRVVGVGVGGGGHVLLHAGICVINRIKVKPFLQFLSSPTTLMLFLCVSV